MSAPYDTNRYRATIIRHIDADTTRATIHLGLDVSIDATLRWAGIDAPERYTEAGKIATAWLSGRLPTGHVCEVETIKVDKFGRYLGTFFHTHDDAESVNAALVRLGYAVPYDGGPR